MKVTTKAIPPFLKVVIPAILALPVSLLAEPRLGMTVAEWNAEMGPPDRSEVYHYRSSERALNTYLIEVSTRGGTIIGMTIRNADPKRSFSRGSARGVAIDFSPAKGGYDLDYERSDDGKTVTVKISPKAKKPPSKIQAKPDGGMVSTVESAFLLGGSIQRWEAAIGKPLSDGNYYWKEYRMEPQVHDGKIVRIRAQTASLRGLQTEEKQNIYHFLTGDDPKRHVTMQESGKLGAAVILTLPGAEGIPSVFK